MAERASLIRGEFVRTIDERWRVSLPPELAALLCPGEEADCVLAKERFGSLSLWSRSTWEQRIREGLDLVEKKIHAGRLENRLADVQTFGRLLSTRFRECGIESKSRVAIPEGFREFLAIEPGGDCIVVGAAICVELWHPKAWRRYLKRRIAAFGTLFEQLSG